MEPPNQTVYRNHSYDNLRLHITSDFFYIEALDSPENDTLVIDRNNYNQSLYGDNNQNEIRLQLLRNPSIPAARSIQHIYGLLGSIQLISGNYLVVISKRKRVGTLHNGHSIWQILETDLIPFNRNTLATLNAAQRQHNESYINLVRNVLNTPYFYFSTSYDLTHSIQRLTGIVAAKSEAVFYNLSLVQRCDTRFLLEKVGRF